MALFTIKSGKFKNMFNIAYAHCLYIAIKFGSGTNIKITWIDHGMYCNKFYMPT